MKLTKEQIETLSQWEENFNTAVKADWTRNPGRAGLLVIYQIFTQVTGDTRRFNDNCNHCILSLVRDCGKLYFQAKADAAKVEAVEQEARPTKKATIKTERKSRK